jgi:hypothetical protein
MTIARSTSDSARRDLRQRSKSCRRRISPEQRLPAKLSLNGLPAGALIAKLTF